MEEILKLKNKSGNIINVKYKVLDLSYIDEIIKLQEDILNGLEDKQLYAPTEKEEFINYLKTTKIIENHAFLFVRLIFYCTFAPEIRKTRSNMMVIYV